MRNLPIRIFILGLSGSGKSALVEKALPKLKKKFEYVILGDFIAKIGLDRTGYSDRDEIRRKTKSIDFKTIQVLALKEVKKAIRGKNAIIDTHACVRTASGFLPGLPLEFLKEMRPSLLIFVEANPKDICKRRLKDRKIGRDRDMMTVNEIALKQEVSKQMTIGYSLYCDAWLTIIQNVEGQLTRGATVLEKAINNLSD